jgi:hypothetical protein
MFVCSSMDARFHMKDDILKYFEPSYARNFFNSDGEKHILE